MRKFIVQYVKGCAACQTSKVNTHPIKPGLIPIQHSGDTRPFRTITMDYITDLPESDGFNAIQVVVDHDVSKAAVFSPCTKNITAEGAMDILQRDVYRRFGLPAKVISDRGPQFISKAFKELHNSLGIEMVLSTAYHPQTDREMERVGQELDLALRLTIQRTWPNCCLNLNSRTIIRHTLSRENPRLSSSMGFSQRPLGQSEQPQSIQVRSRGFKVFRKPGRIQWLRMRRPPQLCQEGSPPLKYR